MPIRYFKILAAAAFLFVALSGSAHAAPAWWPIVPCGLNQQPAGATLQDDGPNGTKVPHIYTKDCNQCDLILLFKNLIDLVINVLVPTLGTAFFIGAGFWILISARSGNANGVKQAQGFMTDTAIGIAIILSAWLITTVVLKTLSNNPNPANPWYEITCTTGDLSNLVNATGITIGGDPTVQAPSGGQSTGQPATDSSAAPASCAAASPAGGCNASTCSNYTASIAKYANGAASANLLKSIMVVESGCNPTKSNAAGKSYGLMQLQVATAVNNAQGCVPNPNIITSSWLTDRANTDAEICIAANYIRSLASACGSNTADLAANYNGNDACGVSKDCQGVASSCGNNPMMRWECPWDDTAHTVPNTGYNETRAYVPKVLYCVNNPGF